MRMQLLERIADKLLSREVFNDDYRLTHNRKYHSDMLKQNKLVRYKEANAPENPFVAAASASRKKAPSSSSTSETVS